MRFWMIGGDARSRWTAQRLIEGCGTVTATEVCGLENEAPPETVEAIVLPFPSFDGMKIRGTQDFQLHELMHFVHSGTRIFGGRLERQAAELRGRGALVSDLYGAEPLTTANAIPTAEGAIELAMQSTPRTLHGANCLVIGFGRIGKVLAQMLAALHARVTVAVRSAASHGLAEALGFAVDVTGEYRTPLSRYDLIFNTVPTPIMDEAHLRAVRENCVLLDLSSPPHGISKELCRKTEKTCVYASGLPAKVAPQTAGELYARQILMVMESGEGR